MKLLAICPNPSDATAFYRVVMPFINLKHVIDYKIQGDASLTDILEADIILLQRPCNDNHLGIAERCKLYKKPLLVDYDDNLFVVPESNPSSPHYSRESVQKNMAKCIQLADHVMVSTSPLEAYLKPLNASISVVPNALDLSIMPERNINWEERKTDILWRGGNSHEEDVASVAKKLIEVSHQCPEWRFLFMGADFRMLEALMKPETYGYAGSFNELGVYYRMLSKLSAPIHIVPLQFNEFNESKSNLAWLEATWAGSAVLMPEMPEWKDLPGGHYNKDSFKGALLTMMRSPNRIKEANEQSWELIKSKYLIEHTNKKRLAILNGLIKMIE